MGKKSTGSVAPGSSAASPARAQAKSGGKRPKESVESKVSKILRDNFKNWSHVQTHATVVNGLTLWQRLLRDKQASIDGTGGPMGSVYYIELRKIYAGAGDPISKIVPTNPGLPLNERLVACMASLRSTNANKAPLCEFLATEGKCNERELCGILRSSLMMRPSASCSQRELIMCVMRYVHKHRLQVDFPELVSHCLPHWDEALCCCLHDLKRSSNDVAVFWSLYSGVASLVVSTSDVEAVLENKGDCTQVKDELQRLCSATQVGRRMFGSVYQTIQNSIVSTVIDEQLSQLPADKVMTTEEIDKIRATVQKAVESKPCAACMAPRRECIVEYRGADIRLRVTTILSEIDYRLGALVRHNAVVQDLVPAILMEDDLSDGKAPLVTLCLAADAVASIDTMRRTLNELLAAAKMNGAEAMREMLQKKEDLLRGINPQACLETQFLIQMSGLAGEKRMESEVLRCLPSLAKPMTVEQTFQELSALQSRPLFRFVTKSCQGAVNGAKEVIHSLRSKQEPMVDKSKASGLMAKVLEAAELFVAHGSGAEQCRGKEAMAMLWKAFVAQVESDPSVIDFAMLSHFSTFKFMLDRDQKAIPHQQIEQVSMRAGLLTTKKTAASGSNSGKEAQKRSKRKADTMQAAMDMFG